MHLSSASAIPLLRAAQKEGVQITAETCLHYLAFSAEEISDGATHFKCAPPIRERENRDRLWRGLGEGTIDLVVSDHSPCTPALKLPDTGDFLNAWGGIASLQFSLMLTWTEAQKRGFGLEQLARWMCLAPAQLAGLQSRKGSIEPGKDADLVVWNPEASVTIEAGRIHHRHPVTPYLGQSVRGEVMMTFLRGQKIYEGGQFLGEPAGVSLARGE